MLVESTARVTISVIIRRIFTRNYIFYCEFLARSRRFSELQFVSVTVFLAEV